MGSINDLKLKNDPFTEQGGSLEDLPEPFGPSQPHFPPGDYRFELPKKFDWEALDTTDYGQRVSCLFNGQHPLTVVQSKGGKLDGETFDTRLSNAPRVRNKEKGIIASDLDYLHKALGETTRARSNRESIQMTEKHAGDQFGASVEWSWHCNKNRVRYLPDDQGGAVEDPEKKNGCGTRYYMADVVTPGQEPPVRINCGQCGASVRAFANLTRIRA